MRSSQSPYGWLSYRWRRSFMTTWRWFSSFSPVIAGSIHPIRSDSSQSARSRWWEGTVS